MTLREYIEGGCRGELDAKCLDEALARFEWFGAARAARTALTGEPDAAWLSIAASRGMSSVARRRIDARKLSACSQENIIERFLASGSHRIVAPEDGEAEPIVTDARLAEEDDLVSEDLASVYRSQRLYDRAIGIYRKLSLLNPEKSVYFAELIGQTEKERDEN